MARRKTAEGGGTRRKPATTPEARENELVSLAHDEAERQMREGKASSQVVTHFLKLGSSREQLEQERLRHENELMQVKKAQLESQQKMEELYEGAINAMRSYAGHEEPIPPPELDDGEI